MNRGHRIVVATLVGLLAAGCGKKQEDATPPPTGSTATGKDGGSAAGTTSAATSDAAPPAPLQPLAADPGSTGKPVWARSIGGLKSDSPRALAVDAEGNTYVVGYFEGEATFGELGKKVATGTTGAGDIFLLKVGKDGKPAWVQTFGSPLTDDGTGVALGADGTIAVTGNFADTMTLGPTFKATAAGADDIFVAGFTADGTPSWLWATGGSDSDGANAIAAAPGGGWLVGGSFFGEVDLGVATAKAVGAQDAFLLRLSAGGDPEWAKTWGSRYKDAVTGVATDPSGSIYVLAELGDSASFGGDVLQSAGGSDVVVAKYDAGGNHLWSTRFGNPFNDPPAGMAVDRAGNVTVTTSFEQETEVAGQALHSHGEGDILIVRLDTTGAIKWHRTWGGDRDDQGHGAAADAAGNVIITGWFRGTVDFGTGPVKTKNTNNDVFVAKLDPKGQLIWVKTFGDRDHDEGYALAVDTDGNPVLAGVYRFVLDLVSPTLESVHAPADKAPPADVFLVRFER